MKMKHGFGVAATLLAAMTAEARAEAPRAGCYERVYDAAHLKTHRGQFVRHARLKLGPTSVPKSEGGANPPVADAILQIWAGTQRTSFDSLGVCWAEGESFVCNGSDSAAETRACKTKAPGLRFCRIEGAHDGRFRIEARPEGLAVKVVELLELPQTGSDAGPFLYLSPDDAENRDFLLKAAPAKACE